MPTRFVDLWGLCNRSQLQNIRKAKQRVRRMLNKLRERSRRLTNDLQNNLRAIEDTERALRTLAPGVPWRSLAATVAYHAGGSIYVGAVAAGEGVAEGAYTFIAGIVGAVGFGVAPGAVLYLAYECELSVTWQEALARMPGAWAFNLAATLQWLANQLADLYREDQRLREQLASVFHRKEQLRRKVRELDRLEEYCLSHPKSDSGDEVVNGLLYSIIEGPVIMRACR